MTQVNPLVTAYLRRRKETWERAELRRIMADLREAQADLDPIRAEANARRKANMRQDGETGFVMVMK
jgi:hypothetical protein